MNVDNQNPFGGDAISTKQILQHTGLPFETVRIRRYLVNGKESTKKELAAQPFVVAGAEEGTAYGFTNEESLCRWAAGTMHADRFARNRHDEARPATRRRRHGRACAQED
jgi:hypothetical protein